MKKTLQIANILALVITLIVNYLSNTGIFNGNTMATVSARYQNLFTPAGYAFSIWGVIYIGLAAFVFYQSQGLFNNKPVPSVVERVGWLFVISCAANSMWVFAWLYDYTGLSVLIMSILLISLLTIMSRTRMELDVIPIKEIALTWWPFATYLGWITVAIIANIAAYLTKIEWSGFGLSDVSWTIVMLCAAGIVYIALTWARNLRESALIGVWGLVAVAIANWDKIPVVAYTAVAVSIVILLSSAIHGYRNKGQHFLEESTGFKQRSKAF